MARLDNSDDEVTHISPPLVLPEPIEDPLHSEVSHTLMSCCDDLLPIRWPGYYHDGSTLEQAHDSVSHPSVRFSPSIDPIPGLGAQPVVVLVGEDEVRLFCILPDVALLLSHVSCRRCSHH